LNDVGVTIDRLFDEVLVPSETIQILHGSLTAVHIRLSPRDLISGVIQAEKKVEMDLLRIQHH
jgi:hypothetical protein